MKGADEMNLRERVDKEILAAVEKPARYIGGEWNSTRKSFADTPCQMAFCFPDVYEVGMSHLGMQILYGLINETTPYLMERCFMPWPDMAGALRERGLPLFSLESYTPLNRFPVVGFTLQYEMSYTNILAMLELGRIPLYARERFQGSYPLVIGGGPCSVNPEPVADFFDAILVGDGEEALPEILRLTEAHLSPEGMIGDRSALLRALDELEGVYVPSMYEARYSQDGVYEGTFHRHVPGRKVHKRVLRDLNKAYYPQHILTSFVDAVHDRMMLEVLRGCTHGCRFCQAGNYYRPVREKEPGRLLELAEGLIRNSGFDDISLTSLSTADYTGVGEVVRELMRRHEEEKIGISLPSLRVDTFSVDLAAQIQKVRKTGFTFAPEAGTQRMRDVINKGVTEEDLMSSLEGAFREGWQRIKLYFMIGLPEERDEDVRGIIQLGKKALELGRKIAGRRNITVTVSVSSFVPKPFTAFQWFGQNSKEELVRKQGLLRDEVREGGRGVSLSYHYSDLSVLEGMLARGDRRLSALLAALARKGACFDSWDEWFRKDLWQEAFQETGLKAEDYSQRNFQKDEPLYWDHIDLGVSKSYLWREYEKAGQEAGTRDCRLGCTGCGVCGDGVEMDLKGAYRG